MKGLPMVNCMSNVLSKPAERSKCEAKNKFFFYFPFCKFLSHSQMDYEGSNWA